MIAWLLHLIGMNEDITSHLNEVRLALHRPEFFRVGLVLLVPAAYFIYRRQQANLPNTAPVLRGALTVTRVVVLALLVCVLADPYLKLDHESEKKPIVALLFDHSQSMRLPLGDFESDAELVRQAHAAGYAAVDGRLDPETRKALTQVSRAKHAQAVVQHQAGSFLEPLARKFDVQFFSFAKDVTSLGVDPANPKLPEPPNPGGTSTYLGDALNQVLTEAGSRQVAGVVVFSDGQNTGGRSPNEVAHTAGSAGTRLFTVPCGAATRLRDVAIVDVFTTGLVSVGDTVRVAVTVESQGFDKQTVQVKLYDGKTPLDSKDLVLRSTEQQQVELTFQAKEPGPRYLTVKIEPDPIPQEPEYLRANNTDMAYVRVSDEKLKVLYLEGLPRWDFRFLKNAMRRDNGLAGRTSREPEMVLEAEHRRRPAQQRAEAFPRGVKELAEYHTIILGDASPQMLDEPFLNSLSEAVREHGVGLVVAAGPQHMPHGFGKVLRELLPVRLRSDRPGLEAPVTKLFRLDLTPEGSVHEAMRFYDDPGRNQNAWSHMPPYYWCADVERPSPAAAVLLANPSLQTNYGKMPLVASHYAGKGKVLFVGTDSTWLWRQNVGDRFFYKFWGQGLRSVARRDQATAKKSWIEVRPIRAQPGEQAQIELMAIDTEGKPVGRPSLMVRASSEGVTNLSEPIEMTADPGAKGRYVGKFVPKNTGDYRVTYDAEAGVTPAEAKFRVSAATEELRHPNVNRPALQQIAAASGGQMVELPDLATIPDQLQGESKRLSLHREATLWDNWLLLVVLVCVYSLDVGLRRLAGLS